MKKTIIALGGSVESLPILRRIKEMGLRLLLIDANPDAPGRQLADEFLQASCYHIPTKAVLEFIGKACGGKPDGCLCSAIDAPQVAAAISAAFGLPGLSVEQAGLGADKLLQINKLQDKGVPVPAFWKKGHSAKRKTPCIIKPIDSRGARGVVRVDSETDWITSLVHARAQSPTSQVIIEKRLDGPQLSTESLVQDGKVLFTAVGLRNYARLEEFAPYCVEDGFDEPYNLFFPGMIGATWQLDYHIDNLIEQSCRALNWFQSGGGVVKGDLVIHNGKLHVIELAPRLSGGLFCAAHEYAYGVDFIGAAINMALGYTIDERKPYPRQFVSQRYLFPKKEHVGKRISSLRGFFPESTVFAHYSKTVGHVIAPVTCHADRLGQALCVGATPQDARERAERAVREMYGGMVIE